MWVTKLFQQHLQVLKALLKVKKSYFKHELLNHDFEAILSLHIIETQKKKQKTGTITVQLAQQTIWTIFQHNGTRIYLI